MGTLEDTRLFSLLILAVLTFAVSAASRAFASKEQDEIQKRPNPSPYSASSLSEATGRESKSETVRRDSSDAPWECARTNAFSNTPESSPQSVRSVLKNSVLLSARLP